MFFSNGNSTVMDDIHKLVTKVEIIAVNTENMNVALMRHIDNEETMHISYSDKMEQITQSMEKNRRYYDSHTREMADSFATKIDDCKSEIATTLKTDYVTQTQALLIKDDALKEGTIERKKDIADAVKGIKGVATVVGVVLTAIVAGGGFLISLLGNFTYKGP